MSDIRCYKTPILDLLRSVPIDGRATHEEGEGTALTYHMIPYGHHCHDAADEIERLREERGVDFEERDRLLERIEELEEQNGLLLGEIARRSEAHAKRIEELEKQVVLSGWNDFEGDVTGMHIITTDQIRAAWERASTIRDEVLNDNEMGNDLTNWALDLVDEITDAIFSELKIVRCEGCKYCKPTSLVASDPERPTCNGEGWVKE